ncbi:MAG TPA: hypothetical protein VJB56_00010 [Candidatus Paceibacterota bacterium]
MFINTDFGLYNLKFATIVHEIGHAIGLLSHAPTNSSILSCGTPAWDDYEFLVFSEQDRANLVSLWNSNSAALYSISGTIKSNIQNRSVFVFAVDIVTGHTYSTLTQSNSSFKINILKPGDYRIFAKDDESFLFATPSKYSPSWYISNTDSTNDPYTGKVLTLNNNSKSVQDINIVIIEKTPPFNLFWAYSKDLPGEPNVYLYSFSKPWDVGDLHLQHTGGDILSVEAYGSNPDYSLGNAQKTDIDNLSYDGVSSVDVSINENALQGDRLIIARGNNGTIQAGLVGLYVIGLYPPSYIPYYKNTIDQNEWISYQMSGAFDFKSLDPDYWKR